MVGNMCFLVFLAVITYCHVIGGTETLVQKLHHPQKRSIELTLEQRACIRTQFFQRNVNNPTCATVQAGIEMLYDVENVIEAIATRLDLFDTFCQPLCGQIIIDSWGICEAFSDIRNEAELLIGMCASFNGRSCYQDYSQLFAAFQDGATCSDGLTSGRCSTDCRTDITFDVQTYGCCVNVPINYMDANNTALGINQAANNLFDDCRVRRPSNCTNSPLGPPRPPTTSPPVTTSRPPEMTTSPPPEMTTSPPPEMTTSPPPEMTTSPSRSSLTSGVGRPIAAAAILAFAAAIGNVVLIHL